QQDDPRPPHIALRCHRRSHARLKHLAHLRLQPNFYRFQFHPELESRLTREEKGVLAFFSAVSSGMLALTGVVFAIGLVVVQFSAAAYSPRLVVMFASSPILFHTLGLFFATFAYSLAALAWTDRGGSGTVPLFSTILVMILLVASMLAFVKLIQGVNDLQINNVLQLIGRRGRAVIRDMFPHLADSAASTVEETATTLYLPQAAQTLRYSGEPRVIASLDIATLVRLAQSVNAIIAIECGVGDTLVAEAVLMRVHGAANEVPEALLMRAIRLATCRTFGQDPKYAIRLLVDIAIRALSPAVNDPTTAVQALDQIEDLLRRLGFRQLDTGCVRDGNGAVRLTFPVSTWQDYLALSFDEIRQFEATSVQVMRRLRAALLGLGGLIPTEDRRIAVPEHLGHLNLGIDHSGFDALDQAAARLQDRQGLGLSRP
ncbi:MAG: DUF2254 domain-containing protein, partial [Acetobacteraceae bacterium]